MGNSNDVRITYPINKNLQCAVQFANDQVKNIYLFYKNINGDIEASKCDDREMYEFLKARAIRDYNR